jgi:hypothetical protein
MTELPLTSIFADEAPSSIDRSGGGSVSEDADVIEPGETVRLKNTTWTPASPIDVIGPGGETVAEGNATPRFRFTPERTGTFRFVAPDGTKVTSVDVESGDGNSGEESTGSPEEWVNTEEPPSPTERAIELPGVVAADNESGMRIASALRNDASNNREGFRGGKVFAALAVILGLLWGVFGGN